VRRRSAAASSYQRGRKDGWFRLTWIPPERSPHMSLYNPNDSRLMMNPPNLHRTGSPTINDIQRYPGSAIQRSAISRIGHPSDIQDKTPPRISKKVKNRIYQFLTILASFSRFFPDIRYFNIYPGLEDIFRPPPLLSPPVHSFVPSCHSFVLFFKMMTGLSTTTMRMRMKMRIFR
jgi:hypothetical protein